MLKKKNKKKGTVPLFQSCRGLIHQAHLKKRGLSAFLMKEGKK